ncbi:MAG: DEAD/DEAH box helicase [Synoicihabitans sp.]
MMSFADLGLSPSLIRALDERNYLAPTPVQNEAIPPILRGRDVWAQAQTGSGKTAAFALPLLQHLSEKSSPTERRTPTLVLVPTRELATQVSASFEHYGKHLFAPPAKIVTASGGVSINPQMMALRGGADVVVATPGRLLDLVDNNALRLDAVETLVLDEADKLFELDFADELSRILERLPPERQNLLFSATFPPAVTTLAERILRDPARIVVTDTPTGTPVLTERAIEVDPPRRTQLLRRLIETNDWARVLVFVSTKYSTKHVAEKLNRLDIPAGALHGELSQGARAQVLAEFKDRKIKVLVATDLAARGLDFVQLPVVVNYDLPRSAIIYTHRAGRTARAGENGEVISFVGADLFSHFLLLEGKLDRPLPREQIEGFQPRILEAEPRPAAPSEGGIKGRRKSKKDKLREALGLKPGQPLNTPRKSNESGRPKAS